MNEEKKKRHNGIKGETKNLQKQNQQQQQMTRKEKKKQKNLSKDLYDGEGLTPERHSFLGR